MQADAEQSFRPAEKASLWELFWAHLSCCCIGLAARFGFRPVTALRRYLNHPEVEVQLAAIKQLKHFGSECAIFKEEVHEKLAKCKRLFYLFQKVDIAVDMTVEAYEILENAGKLTQLVLELAKELPTENQVRLTSESIEFVPFAVSFLNLNCLESVLAAKLQQALEEAMLFFDNDFDTRLEQFIEANLSANNTFSVPPSSSFAAEANDEQLNAMVALSTSYLALDKQGHSAFMLHFLPQAVKKFKVRCNLAKKTYSILLDGLKKEVEFALLRERNTEVKNSLQQVLRAIET